MQKKKFQVIFHCIQTIRHPTFSLKTGSSFLSLPWLEILTYNFPSVHVLKLRDGPTAGHADSDPREAKDGHPYSPKMVLLKSKANVFPGFRDQIPQSIQQRFSTCLSQPLWISNDPLYKSHLRSLGNTDIYD